MTPDNHQNKHSRDWMATIPLVCMALLILAGCASMGRPNGGPRDETPPSFLYSNPAPGALNVDNKRVRIYFDENVQIEDPLNKVVVSPAQIKPPSISAIGKYIQVEFRDTLIPNTTYTIDFSDAIADLNEKNVLDGFATDFSTGDMIDTLRISGMVFKADNLEPAQGMVVGVYSNFTDTTLATLPFERITKTNKLGQFTLRNLKPGNYHIFAINDANRDYRWDRSEDIAFYDTTITPYAETTVVTDTLVGSDGTDSIVSHTATAFYPNDILLTWFNENYSPLYLAKHERPERRKLVFEFATPVDSFPILTIVGSERNGATDRQWSVRTSSAARDSLTYWITDSMVYNNDSLTIAARYLATDSLNDISWRDDTLKFFLRGAKTRRAELKRDAEAAERRKKALEKGDTLPLPPTPVLNLRMTSATPMDLNRLLSFSSDQPVVAFDAKGVKLESMVDTIWTELPFGGFSFANPLNTLEFEAAVDWEPGTKYRVTIDSAAVVGAFGQVNNRIEQEFSTKRLEDYSTVTFNLEGAPDSTAIVVQLLSQGDVVVTQSAAKRDAKGSLTALIDYIPAGTYYARLFIDSNNNGVYDDGSYTDNRQPEEVYYFPKKIALKKNWDVAQSWNIYETPLDLQKPEVIKKNKPEKKKNEQSTTDTTEEEEDEFDTNFNYGAQGNNRNNRNSNNNFRQNRR